MPIPFTCPHCGTSSSVPEQYAGQSGPCRQCGKSITVPMSAGPTVTPVQSSSGPAIVVIVIAVAIVVLLVCGGILAALLLPAVSSAREAARRAQCSNNLRQIGLALHNYHDVYGTLPPAYIPDEEGRPMHSWRVLILPFLGEGPLYDRYDFDEPWDGPNNRFLADLMPQVYYCPSDPHELTENTNYVMIVGERTISDGPTARRFGEVTDGTSNTLGVVESIDEGIHWMEPRDLPFEELEFGLMSRHPGGGNALLLDGSVRFISATIDREVLRAMATIDGGERVGLP